jgi:phage shock protein PspC (stress-responsive transcriptional regulator)
MMSQTIGDMDQNPNGPGGVDANRMRDVQSWRRSRSDRVVAGVCGGVGRALNIDPVLIRVLIAVLVFAGGAGIPLYIAAWLLMPEEGAEKSTAQDLLGERARPDRPWLWPVVVGVAIFVAIGISSSLKIWPFSFPGPLIAIFCIWFFVFRKKGHRHRGAAPHADAPPMPGQTPAPYPAAPQDIPAGRVAADPQTGPSYPAGPASSATQRPQDTVTSGPVWTEDDPLGLYVDEEPVPVPRPESAPQRRNRRWVKPVVTAAAALATLVAWGAGSAAPLAFAIGLGTLGVGMVIGAFLGRTRGLVPVGLLLAVAVAATSFFPTVPEFADKSFAPTGQLTSATANYSVGVGSLKLDLRNATFAPNTTVTASGDAAEIVVTLPPDVDVTGTATARTAGEVIVFGEKAEGHRAQLTINNLGEDGKAGPERVTLDLDLRIGSIRVERG